MSDAQRPRKTSSRSHVTTACISCRSSKLKCDGVRPQCSRCRKKGAECEFPVGEDKRKVSLQNAIPHLVTRIRDLSQFILEHDLQVPPVNIESRSILSGLLDVTPSSWTPPPTGVENVSEEVEQSPSPEQNQTWGTNTSDFRFTEHTFELNSDRFNVFSSPETSFAKVESFPEQGVPSVFQASSADPLSGDGALLSIPDHTSDTSGNLFWDSLQQIDPISDNYLDWELLNGLVKSPGKEKDDAYSVKNVQSNASLNNQLISGPATEDETEEDVITFLSARLGVLQLAPDGQLRYYGATSNFNLLKISLDPYQDVDIRSIRRNGQEVLDRAKVGASINQELEDHLINLYFAWQDPSYHIVDREMFESAKCRWDSGSDSPYYSEVLKNAMCALGSAFEARFHPSFPTFPKPLAEYFGDRAKALLELELDSPTVATVQALVILSSHEAAHKRDARGWLYSGMAMRLAHDLGLHVDSTEPVRLGHITAAEAEVRCTAFWGAFVSAHLWSFYLGRDFRPMSEEISVKRPCPSKSEAKLWKAYGSSGSHVAGQSLPDPLVLVSLQWVLLCEIVGTVSHMLFGCIEVSKPDLQRLCFETTRQLWEWKENIPKELQIDISRDDIAYLPHTLMLHMQYYSFQIFVHRPWTSKTAIQPFPPQGPGPNHARQVCIESAVAVAKILRMYEKHYTFRLMNIQAVHIIFTAIPVLIFATMSSSIPKQEGDLAAHLGTCFRALEVLGQVFDSAKRAHGYLQAMQRMWPNMKDHNQVAKRRKLV